MWSHGKDSDSNWDSAPPSLLIPGKNLLLNIPTLMGIEPETAACKAVNVCAAAADYVMQSKII